VDAREGETVTTKQGSRKQRNLNTSLRALCYNVARDSKTVLRTSCEQKMPRNIAYPALDVMLFGRLCRAATETPWTSNPNSWRQQLCLLSQLKAYFAMPCHAMPQRHMP
jgi:hypothetical protein